MREKIQQYERRLLEDRQKLLELTLESQTDDSEMLKRKIEYFRSELAYMENQLELLKKQMGYNSAIPQAQVNVNEFENQPAQSKPNVLPQQAYTNIPPQSAYVPLRYQKKDIEKTIGKSLMGIFASVLIFISLILFATLVLPYLGDAVKIAILYIISFTFVGIGIYKLQKDEKNNFFVAITGCGVGALYISLFLTNVYFKVIGDITLYIFIALWAMGVCWLSRYKNKIFQIIGQIGITIAVIFGCVLCISTDDLSKFVVLTIFYAVASNVFYLAHFEKEVSQNVMHHIFNIINFLVLYAGSVNFIEGYEKPYGLMIFIVLMIVAHLGIIYMSTWSEDKLGYGIIVSAYVIEFAIFMTYMISDYDVFIIFMYVVAIVLSIVTEVKMRAKSEGKNVIQAAMLVMSAISVLDMDNAEYMLPILMVIPLTAFGFILNNGVYKYGALVLQLIAVFSDWGRADGGIITLGVLAIAIMYAFMCIKKEQYTYAYKVWAYLITLFFIIASVDSYLISIVDEYEVRKLIVFILALAYNLIMRKWFAKNFATDEEEKYGLYDIVNVITMFVGMSYIGSFDVVSTHLIVIMAMLIAFMVNVKNLMERSQSLLTGIYVGLKFTILMIVILDSFKAVNYTVSICCFLFAIASVIVGFATKYKSLRIYGLVLSMISIFKLIMIDINYTNTLGNAMSFFASGMLCFVISMIYNYVDKKFSQDE